MFGGSLHSEMPVESEKYRVHVSVGVVVGGHRPTHRAAFPMSTTLASDGAPPLPPKPSGSLTLTLAFRAARRATVTTSFVAHKCSAPVHLAFLLAAARARAIVTDGWYSSAQRSALLCELPLLGAWLHSSQCTGTQRAGAQRCSAGSAPAPSAAARSAARCAARRCCLLLLQCCLAPCAPVCCVRARTPTWCCAIFWSCCRHLALCCCSSCCRTR
jgi:hypothetical protein